MFFGEANVKQGNSLPGIRKCAALGLILLVGNILGWGQQAVAPANPPDESMAAAVHELQEQVRELRAAVAEIRSEAAQYRAETLQLRHELQANQSQLGTAGETQASRSESAAVANTAAGANPPAATDLNERVAALEESSQMLNSKVDEQYQTKVEAASKYRLRLSGIALFNLFSNRGSTDNKDFPTWATAPGPFDSKGNFGATLRQSELGLEAFGPQLAGARTSANLQVDFSGGFTGTGNGTSLGLVRLRIASMRLDWDHTSIVGGQDTLFLSPLSPTSFASLAVPAFGYAGNLWGWIPQVRVEHRFDLAHGQTLTLQGGILDNVTDDLPYDSFLNFPQAGERSSQPAYGMRVAWAGKLWGQPMSLGAAGYYSRQNWIFDHHVDGWAGMADWNLPLTSRLILSGEFYQGAAVGGIGGGIGNSVVYNNVAFDPTTRVRGLESIGGWSQLKFRATGKLEFNGAYGLDNPFGEDLRAFPFAQNYLGLPLQRNQSILANFIYRPRSNLLFSTEYRHLKTAQLDMGSWSADQVNMMMGVLF